MSIYTTAEIEGRVRVLARAAWLHEVRDDFDTLDEDGFGFDDHEGAA